MTQGSARAPFQVHVLRDGDCDGNVSKPMDFAALLPASTRRHDDILTPQPHDYDFLAQELLVPRLNAIEEWLWLCGRPMPPRPLHKQSLMGRDITITEDVDMHLVWSKNRIFVKPMPPYLLDPDFWTAHLVPGSAGSHVLTGGVSTVSTVGSISESSGPGSKGGGDGASTISPQQQQEEVERTKLKRDIFASARGFLFSYTALVMYESDFRLAQNAGLLPATVVWDRWKMFCAELSASHDYGAVNTRYWYGELRLSRLNKVYRFARCQPFRGYSTVGGYMTYVDMLRDNFAVLATVLGYVVIVLAAMQVGLATSVLQSNYAFQSASSRFSVFSILAPPVAGALIFVALLIRVATNWAATSRYEARRFRAIGVNPAWKRKGGRRAAKQSGVVE